MPMPELPVEIDPEARQVQGERDKELAQTHRGRKRDQLTNPPLPAQGWMRYPEEP